MVIWSHPSWLSPLWCNNCYSRMDHQLDGREHPDVVAIYYRQVGGCLDMRSAKLAGRHQPLCQVDIAQPPLRWELRFLKKTGPRRQVLPNKTPNLIRVRTLKLDPINTICNAKINSNYHWQYGTKHYPLNSIPQTVRCSHSRMA